PTPEPAPAPKPAPPLMYVTSDASGIVVDLSDEPWTREELDPHGLCLLRSLIEDEAFAGRWVLEKVIKKCYATLYYHHSMRTPWPTVLRDFHSLLKAINWPKDPKTYRTYKWVSTGGRRRRLRVYRIPSPEELGARRAEQANNREPDNLGEKP